MSPLIGIGLSAVSLFIRWRLPSIAKPVASFGAGAAVALVAVGAFLPTSHLYIQVPWLICGALAGLSADLVQDKIRFRLQTLPEADDQDKPLEAIHGRVFRNERVVLDGKSYTGCTFQSCTLVFNGGKTALVGNDLQGVAFASDDPKIEGSWHIFQALGYIRAQAFLPDDLKGRPPGWGLRLAP